MIFITSALPWFGRKKAPAKVATTTHGGDEPTRWQVVARNLTPLLATIIKGRLESQEIPAIIQHEAVGTVFGLTTGPLGWAAVLVPEALAEQALAILAEEVALDEDDFTDASGRSDILV